MCACVRVCRCDFLCGVNLCARARVRSASSVEKRNESWRNAMSRAGVAGVASTQQTVAHSRVHFRTYAPDELPVLAAGTTERRSSALIPAPLSRCVTPAQCHALSAHTRLFIRIYVYTYIYIYTHRYTIKTYVLNTQNLCT